VKDDATAIHDTQVKDRKKRKGNYTESTFQAVDINPFVGTW